MFLQAIDGHEKVVGGLRSALIHGRVAHAYIFSGPAGSGKREVAGGLAAALLCGGERNGYACGRCKDCIQYKGGNHPDLMEISPQGVSVKIEQIRDMQKHIGYRAFQGGFKICFIDCADAMTTQAANCLLKTLEEPDGKVVFVLLTTNPGALLPTIRSRCQLVQFAQEKLATANEYRQEVWASLKVMQRAGDLDAIELAEKYAKLSREDVCNHLEVMALLIRDMLVWKETGDIDLLANTELSGELAESGHLYSTFCLVRLIEEIEKTTRQIENRAFARLALEVLFLELISFFRVGHC